MEQTENTLMPFGKRISLRGVEVFRTYVFPGGEEVTIDEPQYLIVSDNGHRVLDDSDRCHYIPYGWIHLFWRCVDLKDTGFLCEKNQ